MIDVVSTSIAISVFFILVCGSACLKDKYYRDNYYKIRPSHHYYRPLNDSYSESV